VAGYSGTPLPKKLGIKEGHDVAFVAAPADWPKRASGVETDMTEDVAREIALANGLVDNKVCAIDETWSGLRLVIRLEDR
jgi:hypothetical protein